MSLNWKTFCRVESLVRRFIPAQFFFRGCLGRVPTPKKFRWETANKVPRLLIYEEKSNDKSPSEVYNTSQKDTIRDTTYLLTQVEYRRLDNHGGVESHLELYYVYLLMVPI